MPHQELLEIERKCWDSLCSNTASEVYGDVMLPDGLMVLAGGTVMDRDQVVSILAQAPPWKAYSIENARTVSASPNAATLCYLGRARNGDEGWDAEAYMTSSYVRVDGHWRLAAYTQTPLASS